MLLFVLNRMRKEQEMAIRIEATPILEGDDAVHFLKRIEFWASNPVTLKEVKIDNDAVDKAVEAIRVRRAARKKAVKNAKQK